MAHVRAVRWWHCELSFKAQECEDLQKLQTGDQQIVGQKLGNAMDARKNLAGHSCLGSNKLQSCVVLCAATSHREQAPGRMIEARLTQGGVLKSCQQFLGNSWTMAQ